MEPGNSEGGTGKGRGVGEGRGRGGGGGMTAPPFLSSSWLSRLEKFSFPTLVESGSPVFSQIKHKIFYCSQVWGKTKEHLGLYRKSWSILKILVYIENLKFFKRHVLPPQGNDAASSLSQKFSSFSKFLFLFAGTSFRNYNFRAKI